VQALRNIYEGFRKTSLHHIFIGDFNVQLGKEEDDKITNEQIYEALNSIGGKKNSYRTMIPSDPKSSKRTMISLKKEYCNDTVVVPVSLLKPVALIVGPKEMFFSKIVDKYVVLRLKDLERLKISGFTDHFPVKILLKKEDSDSTFDWEKLEDQRIRSEKEFVEKFIKECRNEETDQNLRRIWDGYRFWMNDSGFRPINQDTLQFVIEDLKYSVIKGSKAYKVKNLCLIKKYKDEVDKKLEEEEKEKQERKKKSTKEKKKKSKDDEDD
jgi:hypothetical protein